jgi:hypothetical protein
MPDADRPVHNPSDERPWPVTTLGRSPHLKSLSQKASNFVSGRWGTLALFAVLTVWIVATPFVGWSRAYQTFDQFIAESPRNQASENLLEPAIRTEP